jgi:RNA binding exosome subunit
MDKETSTKMVVAAMKLIQEKADIAELWGSYGNQAKLLETMIEIKACMNIVQNVLDKDFFCKEEDSSKRESEEKGDLFDPEHNTQ